MPTAKFKNALLKCNELIDEVVVIDQGTDGSSDLLSTMEAERCFSSFGKIRNKWRSRMHGDLMYLSMAGVRLTKHVLAVDSNELAQKFHF